MARFTDVLVTPETMQAWSAQQRLAGRRVSFVPTMGALHDGHLELVRQARRHGDAVVVSIFVNPLQFDRPDDFDAYPRPIDADVEACHRAGVDAVYAPVASTMYPPGFQTTVVPGALAEPMEGGGRPGHFAGVTTVVTKLFNAVRPDVALFGQKDFQQLAIIRRMTADLDFGIEIVGVPIVREADGLARSSRNTRLGASERAAAVAVPRSLDAVEESFRSGERSTAALHRAAVRVLDAEPLSRLEYLEFADVDTLAPVEQIVAPTVAAIVVWFGDVRLIDNRVLDPDRDDVPVRRS
ncbi:MAG: pantoate--beta-alanine ligase [Ilumatobacteraceae bacterium]